MNGNHYATSVCVMPNNYFFFLSLLFLINGELFLLQSLAWFTYTCDLNGGYWPFLSHQWTPQGYQIDQLVICITRRVISSIINAAINLMLNVCHFPIFPFYSNSFLTLLLTSLWLLIFLIFFRVRVLLWLSCNSLMMEFYGKTCQYKTSSDNEIALWS